MCPDKKALPNIDVEKLKQTTAAAITAQNAAEIKKSNDAAAKKKIDDDWLFTYITGSLPTKMAEAAAQGLSYVQVWEMGDFGHRNSDEITEETPIDWDFFERLEQWCKDKNLITERKTEDNHETGHNFFSKAHIYYVLIASWPEK